MKYLVLAITILTIACNPTQSVSSSDVVSVTPEVVVTQATSAAETFTRRPTLTSVIPHAETRTADQLADAACYSPNGEWRCNNRKKPTILAASSTSSPIFPQSWTVGNWYLDPANSIGCASDNNSGTSATCTGGCSGSVCPSGQGPIVHWGELQVHRWGCGGSPRGCPRQKQDTNRNWLSNQSDNTDPVYDFPTVENAANVVHTNVLPSAANSVCGASATLANVTNLNRGTNLQLAQVNRSGGGACTLAKGEFIINATHPSRAWVYANNASDGGSNIWQWSVPWNSSNSSTTPSGTAPVAWSNGDSVTVYSFPQVDIVAMDPVFADWNPATFANFPLITHLHIFDPTGPANDPITLGSRVVAYESSFDRGAIVGSQTLDNGVPLYNDYFAGGGIAAAGNVNAFSSILVLGGVISSQFTTPTSTLNGPITLGGDIIINGIVTMTTGVSNQNAFFKNGIGTVYIETGATLNASGDGVFFEPTNVGGPAPVVYGPGTLAFQGGGRWAYPTGAGAAAATFKETGFSMNGSSKMAILNLANAAPWTGNITTGVSALDSNLGTTAGCAVALGFWLCNTAAF